jgi:hypothetical protein
MRRLATDADPYGESNLTGCVKRKFLTVDKPSFGEGLRRMFDCAVKGDKPTSRYKSELNERIGDNALNGKHL